MTQLTQLALYNNSLTGSIPTEIGQMTQLTWLSLWNNGLTGVIPTEIGQVTQTHIVVAQRQHFDWFHSN